MLGLVVLLFLGWLAAIMRPRPPDLAADCARAAFTLSATTVERGKPVTFRIVGVEGRTYALGLDTATFRRTAGGTWEPVPRPGRESSMLVPASPEALRGCTRTGLFGTPVPAGPHTVTLYELTATSAVVVAEQRLEVTEP